MRKITYLIDDKAGFSKSVDEEMLKDIEGFKAYYTLEETEKGLYYCLENSKLEQINIDSLNGYQKIYLNECLKCFRNKEEISAKYTDFITILDTPHEIKHTYNERFQIFQEYAKQNNIPETNLNYINFIDKYTNKYKQECKEPDINNTNKFNEYLRSNVLVEEKSVNIKETSFYKFFREELDRIIESYSNPCEYNLDKLEDKDLEKITEELLNDDYFNQTIDNCLQEILEKEANLKVEEETL